MSFLEFFPFLSNKANNYMFQRIQSLYLTLGVVCSILLCCYAPMSFASPEEATDQKVYAMDFRHIHEMMFNAGDELVHAPNGAVMSIWGLSVLSVVIGLLCLVDMFLFNKRILQARLNIITVVCCLGYYALLAMYAWFAVQRLDVEWFVEWAAAMPLVIVVLVMMATRAILKDEALVRAADRLR